MAWYTAKLGSALTAKAVDRGVRLGDVLADAIQSTADQQRDCDLTHPGTPSAAVAMFRLNGDAVDYLVLGDVTLAADTAGGVQVVTDARVSATAKAERAEADRYPFGSAEKQPALPRMKHAELAAHNEPGGYWVAGENPTVFMHAIHGSFPLDKVRRIAHTELQRPPDRTSSS
ncbi:hypothetical protein ONA70_18725 [Micromonospora yasonensis]|uniref:hypothetical protein n=1 Tax=Micromonospora yasonensis TaxID=1128667 RepID=UPI00222E1EED|nr:hypothetical protein [Micromonospora yasonensis]MCW3842136.1 hypothetical protein [Micromonospora yasonensis]